MKEIYKVQGNKKLGFHIALPTKYKVSDYVRIEKKRGNNLVVTPVDAEGVIAKAKKAVDGA